MNKQLVLTADVIQTRKALLRNTIIFNHTGLPAVTIPIGLTKEDYQ